MNFEVVKGVVEYGKARAKERIEGFLRHSEELLARGELHCIGATTLNEYRLYIEKDAALERRFQPVMVSEPTVEDTVAILRGLKERYEVYHGVKIQDGALIAAATLSNRYITDRFLPDKAIDLIDEAGSRVIIKYFSQPSELENIKKVAAELVADEGYEYGVDVTLTLEEYPTRNYESMSFPSGEYTVQTLWPVASMAPVS